jgi:hypothetical protein
MTRFVQALSLLIALTSSSAEAYSTPSWGAHPSRGSPKGILPKQVTSSGQVMARLGNNRDKMPRKLPKDVMFHDDRFVHVANDVIFNKEREEQTESYDEPVMNDYDNGHDEDEVWEEDDGVYEEDYDDKEMYEENVPASSSPYVVPANKQTGRRLAASSVINNFDPTGYSASPKTIASNEERKERMAASKVIDRFEATGYAATPRRMPSNNDVLKADLRHPR